MPHHRTEPRSLLTVHLARTARALAGAVAALLLLAPAPPAQAASQLSCERIPQLFSAYFQKHISYGYLNPELRQRAVESQLENLDPSKTLYLADEADRLRIELAGLFHEIYGGDCQRLEKIHADTVNRYKHLEDTVRKIVGAESYAVDPDVTLILDPDKRGHPRTDKARDELVTKLVHFQMSNYLDSDMDMAEAKEKLIHRYELMTKRASEFTREDVYGAFLDAFARSMDPHTHYFTADAYEDFQIEMQLSLEGIGVALSSRDGYSVVESIIPGGAADKVGTLQPKDKIIAVAQEDGDWVDVIDMSLRDVVSLIRGKRDSKVHLRVLRQGETTQTLNVTIVRDKIDLEERSAKLRFEEIGEGDQKLKLAVIELPSFYGDRNPAKRQSSRDVRNLIAAAKQAGADGLLLDLSRNGGGLLETAVEITGYFIRDGGVVAVKGTDSGIQVLPDDDASILYDGPMAVLTSRVSASASEIVAGALKDYERALILGDDHTFGKGTVQSMVPLPPGLGALKVTTALFFRPGGASTQHDGVPSDLVIPSLIGSSDDFGEKSQDYSLPGQSIDPFLSLPGPDASDSARPWPVVTPALVAQLAERSTARIAESDEFGEVLRQIAESKEREDVVRLSEIMERDKGVEPGAGDASVAPPSAPPSVEASEEASEEPTPQQQEALRILADFVRLVGNQG